MLELLAFAPAHMHEKLAAMGTIHEAIRDRREALGLSMQDLALRVSEKEGRKKPLSWQTIQQWENGKSAPTRSRMPFVAEVLKSTAQKLLAGDSTPEQREVDQPVSHPIPMLAPQQIQWESIKVEGLPRSFTLVIRDGALGDEFPRGSVGYFELYEPGVVDPMEGKAVLFGDREGAPFVRLYEVQRGTSWRAVAAAKGYAPMDSEQDGLTILAVMLGGFWRPPTR